MRKDNNLTRVRQANSFQKRLWLLVLRFMNTRIALTSNKKQNKEQSPNFTLASS